MFCEKPGWVRESNGSSLPRLGPLALPRSPESGVAVSTRAKFLSREKRKIWTLFFVSVYILWCCSRASPSHFEEFATHSRAKLFASNFICVSHAQFSFFPRSSLFPPLFPHRHLPKRCHPLLRLQC